MEIGEIFTGKKVGFNAPQIDNASSLDKESAGGEKDARGGVEHVGIGVKAEDASLVFDLGSGF